MKLIRSLLIVTLFNLAVYSIPANAANLYQVSLLRASPGQLPSLIEQVKARKQQLDQQMLIMRHSQGDHWDLMLLMPATHALPLPYSYQEKVDFQHDFLVTAGVDWPDVRALGRDAGLFHIEMFHAAKGAYAGLLQQRQMENNYLVATQRNANLIFETYFGSDVDMFTLGFYPDMQAFAAEPDLSDAVFEKAATDAGFKSRSDIGFYLRQFLVSHQDTLASQVQ